MKQGCPDWFNGEHIDEMLFCHDFLTKHPMKCVCDRLFTVNGAVENERQISVYVTTNLAKRGSNLLASVKLLAYSPPRTIETDCIHDANGTSFMDGRISSEKDF